MNWRRGFLLGGFDRCTVIECRAAPPNGGVIFCKLLMRRALAFLQQKEEAA